MCLSVIDISLSSCSPVALALLVSGIRRADDVEVAVLPLVGLTTDDLAVLTTLLDGGVNLHAPRLLLRLEAVLGALGDSDGSVMGAHGSADVAGEDGLREASCLVCRDSGLGGVDGDGRTRGREGKCAHRGCERPEEVRHGDWSVEGGQFWSRVSLLACLPLLG